VFTEDTCYCVNSDMIKREEDSHVFTDGTFDCDKVIFV
jgi:hypothetical protein